MSRVAMPPKAPPMAPPPVPVQVPRDKIAARAYEKWCQGGCCHGKDQHDWYNAEQELLREFQRSPAMAVRR